MKNTTNEVLEYLSTSKNLLVCDIYTLTLKNGNVYRFADFDTDVDYGGFTYSHTLMGLPKRQQIKLQSQVTVDSMTVEIYNGADDLIENMQLNKAAHDGILDRAMLSLSRCYFNNQTVLGAVQLFSGMVEIKQCGGLSLQITAKAKTQGLNMEFPLRRYYPQGVYINDNNTVRSSSDNTETCMITPFIPLREVLM